jgi:glycosyltransferase involved in cell wall biosynthesis
VSPGAEAVNGSKRLRLAVVVSHPIQHFAPWHREIARVDGVDLKVFFCCDWGIEEYHDPEFQIAVKWDVPLLEGYEHEFLPIRARPERMSFWEVDNPGVVDALERFRPDVVKVFGYARRTNWRVVSWAARRGVPVLLYSDSNAKAEVASWRRAAKWAVVRRFYGRVDGAFYCGDNNRDYHLRYGLPPDRLVAGGLPIARRRLLDSVEDPKAARAVVRERHGIPDDAFVVIACGKYIARKRPLDLVRAAWLEASRGLGVWSLLVGEGPERRAIEDFCRAEGVDNCTLTGFVNQKQIAEYYAASDAIAVTSDYDAHPLAVSEAASFGLPVIVSDKVGCVGVEDTARPGANALVYPCGDVERLGAAIAAVCGDAVMYDRMSRASLAISETQDAAVLAEGLVAAARRLDELGPRRARRRPGGK